MEYSYGIISSILRNKTLLDLLELSFQNFCHNALMLESSRWVSIVTYFMLNLHIG